MAPDSVSMLWSAVAPALGNHLWQSTLIACGTGLLAVSLRRNRARTRYWIWMTASAKFLLPFSLLVGLGSRVPWPRSYSAPRSAAYAALERASLPFAEPTELPNAAPLEASTTGEPSAQLAPQPVVRANPLHWLPGALMAIWLGGFIVTLARWAARWRQVRAVVRAGVPMREGREVEILRRLESIEVAGARKTGIRRPIQMIATRGLIEPGVFGILRPVLMWPEGISARLDDAHLEAVLTHEIWHVRRWDNLSAALHRAVEALFWFHPLVWWLDARLADERERACDEAVIEQHNQREAYAESILKVCEFCVEAPLPCVSGVTGSDLKKRIVHIMTKQVGRRLTLGRKLLLFATALTGIAVPVLAGALGAPMHLPPAVRPTAVIAAVDQVATSVKAVAPMIAQALTPVAVPQPAATELVGFTPSITPQTPGDLTGDWQGTLHAGQGLLRIVLKISKTESGWSAVDYSIDQGSQGMNCSGVTLQGTAFKYSIPYINGYYEGTLSADGRRITGFWTQNNGPRQLDLERATQETAWEIPQPPTPPKPMAADADPSFDVATIKPTNPDVPGDYFQVKGRHFTTHNISLAGLIKFAYGVHAKQIVNGPEWIDKDKYDIDAVPADQGSPSNKQWKTMLQKLLVNRFKLAFHRDRKELSVFALTAAKGGPKNLAANTSGGPLPSLFFRGTPGGILLPGRNATMADLTGLLQEVVLDRPVVDQTGLKGRFDFVLKWAPDDSQFGGHPPTSPSDEPNAPPNLFTAMQEQLGLKLEAVKAPVEVLVLDHVEKPSPN